MKTKFGDIIKYDDRFYDVIYINNKELIDSKLYNTDKFDKTEPIKPLTEKGKLGLLSDKKKYPPSIRKIIFYKESGEGIVIGQRSKREGKYHPACGGGPPYYDDYEQAWLDVTKSYTFWVVTTEMNRTILVPKK